MTDSPSSSFPPTPALTSTILSPTAKTFSPSTNPRNSDMITNTNDRAKGQTNTANSASMIIPSQAMNAASRNRRRRQGGRGGRNNRKNKASDHHQQSNNIDTHVVQGNNDNAFSSTLDGKTEKATIAHQDDDKSNISQPKKKRNKKKDLKKAKNDDHPGKEQPISAETNTKKKNKRKKKKKEKFPWRKHIPPGSIDPISLDPLDELLYPPFALKISPPYDAIPEWPIPQGRNSEDSGSNKEKASAQDIKIEREKKLLQEQWGSFAISSKDDNDIDNTNNNGSCALKPQASSFVVEKKEVEEHYHLFDGRVLAYYLVSQLQFIDPLNRRDLTRDEIIQLDSYLVRHNLSKRGANQTNSIRVLEAYDAKGVTASVAGVSGQSRRGRADILQQEARVLLNAIFEGNLVGNGSRNMDTRDRGDSGGRNELARQYAESQSNNERINGRNNTDSNNNTARNNESRSEGDDVGIYVHEGGGMLIIDDDFNPGLRGGEDSLAMQDYDFSQRNQTGEEHLVGRSNPTWTARNHLNNNIPVVDSQGSGPSSPIAARNDDENENTIWTSRNILTRHSHAARVRADNFPTLAETTTATDNNSPATPTLAQVRSQASNDKGKVSSSLSKIGNMVLKVSAKQLEKQRKARDEALHKAGISTNSGFSSGSSTNNLYERGTLSTTENNGADGIGNHELGLKSSCTTLKRFNTGWARPTSYDKNSASKNNIPIIYPDTLIIKARELMPELLKLERKWITFLRDDTAASCPLKAMDRPTRTFSHEYSDFWNLHTESFDPEPKRYIHCVKLDETSAPFPLLSQAVRTWKGPTRVGIGEGTLTVQQTAGQSTMSNTPPISRTGSRGALHLPEERVPLKLAPPAKYPPNDRQTMPQTLSINASKGPSPVPQKPAPRFAPLLAERDERTKLILEPRTKPLELPPFQPMKITNLKESIEADRKAAEEKTIRLKEKKESILATAFASEDEEDSGEESDWDVGDAIYSGSSDEED